MRIAAMERIRVAVSVRPVAENTKNVRVQADMKMSVVFV